MEHLTFKKKCANMETSQLRMSKIERNWKIMGKITVPVYEVVGLKKEVYKFDDGRKSEGMRLFMTTDTLDPDGQGKVFSDFYLSYEKLQKNNYLPKLGDLVQYLLGKTGKPDVIGLADEESLGVVTDAPADHNDSSTTQKKKLF